MVSIHGPLGYEPNTLTTAPLRSCLPWRPEGEGKPGVRAKKLTAPALPRSRRGVVSPRARTAISPCRTADPPACSRGRGQRVGPGRTPEGGPLAKAIGLWGTGDATTRRERRSAVRGELFCSHAWFSLTFGPPGEARAEWRSG